MRQDFGVDLDRARAFLDAKERRRQGELDARFEVASRDFEAIVARIVERFAPSRVWQWGSLLDRDSFSEISDIDIAIEGLEGGPAAWFALIGEVMGMSDFKLDILELERIRPENADHIRQSGKLVYERKS
ncbi:MAG: hypothetical protein M0001_14570 [Treponema sp.]|nr:hypothetical protein [Treponema sp.]